MSKKQTDIDIYLNRVQTVKLTEYGPTSDEDKSNKGKTPSGAATSVKNAIVGVTSQGLNDETGKRLERKTKKWNDLKMNYIEKRKKLFAKRSKTSKHKTTKTGTHTFEVMSKSGKN